jgi:hypothetical protein
LTSHFEQHLSAISTLHIKEPESNTKKLFSAP